MPNLLRSLHDRVKVRGWVVLGLVLATTVAAPLLLRTRFVAERRAQMALDRAQTHLTAHEFDGARTEFQAALRLAPGNAEARKRLAAMELGLGHTDLAFLAFQNLTEMHPEDAEGWIVIADLMMKAGLLEAPEAALDNAIDDDAQRADARLKRGEIRFRLGRYHGALQDARAAVDAAPKDPAAWEVLVRSTARAERSDAGLAALARATAAVGDVPALRPLRSQLEAARSDPALLAAEAFGPPPAPPRRLRPDAQTDRGSLGAWTREHWPGRLAEIRGTLDAAIQRKDWPEAERIVAAAEKEAPGTAFAPYLAGVLALARGDVDGAEAHLLKALALAPRLPATLGALGRTWSRRGGAAYTAHQLSALAERDPGLALARYMAARAFIEAGDPPRAEGILRRGLELQPDSAVPYQHLTDYDFGLDRAQEALDICRQGLARFPRDTSLQMMHPQILAAVGQPAAAIQAYQEVATRRPDLDLAQYKLAILLANDSAPSSRPLFLAALQKLRGDRPSDPFLLDALGWMHHRAGNAQLARELLESAVERTPEEPTFHYHLALVYRQGKELEHARRELQLALDSPRPFPERIEALRTLRQDEPASSGGH